MALLLIIIVFYFLWNLLVQGMLWKIITGIFGWLGMYWSLLVYFPDSKQACFVFSGGHVSWAQVIPTIIVLMAILYRKE
jgi:hypothetical protein